MRSTILASEKKKASPGGCKVLWSLFSSRPPPAARHGDQEAQRNIENVQSQVNRKNYGLMDARTAVASMVGAAVVDGLEMRAAPDDRGQPRANCKTT